MIHWLVDRGLNQFGFKVFNITVDIGWAELRPLQNNITTIQVSTQDDPIKIFDKILGVNSIDNFFGVIKHVCKPVVVERACDRNKEKFDFFVNQHLRNIFANFNLTHYLDHLE